MRLANSPRSMSGLSLVELMVAVTIGLIIMAAVSAVFVNSRANYTTQESVARLQENARIALNTVARDLRMAGYYGCADSKTAVTSDLSGGAGVAYNISVAVEGMKGTTNILYPSSTNATTLFPAGATSVTSKDARCPGFIGSRCTGTDAVAVRLSDPTSRVALTASMLNTSAALTVSSSLSGIQSGDVIVVSDCGAGDLVKITGVTNASGVQTLAHATGGTPSNATSALSRNYIPPAVATKYVNKVYYIGTGASGYPALFWRDLAGAISPSEVVDGISDMQVLYGVTASAAANREPLSYLTADGVGTTTDQWQNVISARVTLTAIPMNTTNPSAAVNGSTQVQPKQFVSTILIRNSQ